MKGTDPMTEPKSPAVSTVTEFDEQLAELARALSHPARVAIVRHLATRGTCVCGEIVDVLPLAQATVSQHLKGLKEAGLVQGEVDRSEEHTSELQSRVDI